MSGKYLLGDKPLPCEVERDLGRLYRDYEASPDSTNATERDAILDKYREAMNRIGRSVTGRFSCKNKDDYSFLSSLCSF